MRLALIVLLSLTLPLAACTAGGSPSAAAPSRAGSVASASSPRPTAPPSNGQPPAGAVPSSSTEADPLLAYELVDVRTGESFTLGELAAEEPVLVETMAIWCTTCLQQQREVVQAHELADFASVGIDVDPNERADDLADYADREGFDWRFVKADATLVQLLTARYGFGVTNPPSTPTFIVSGDHVRQLEFGRVRSAEELVAELGG